MKAKTTVNLKLNVRQKNAIRIASELAKLQDDDCGNLRKARENLIAHAIAIGGEAWLDLVTEQERRRREPYAQRLVAIRRSCMEKSQADTLDALRSLIEDCIAADVLDEDTRLRECLSASNRTVLFRKLNAFWFPETYGEYQAKKLLVEMLREQERLVEADEEKTVCC